MAAVVLVVGRAALDFDCVPCRKVVLELGVLVQDRLMRM